MYRVNFACIQLAIWFSGYSIQCLFQRASRLSIIRLGFIPGFTFRLGCVAPVLIKFRLGCVGSDIASQGCRLAILTPTTCVNRDTSRLTKIYISPVAQTGKSYLHS
jgi:hypothetical protein